MTLPASGTLSLGQVAAELGIGLPLSLGDSRVRALAGVPSGPISLGNLYGKSAYTPMTLTALGGSSGPANTENGAGTISGQAQVDISGGVAPYSIQWSVTQNASNCTIGPLNGQFVTASHAFAKLSNGSATVVLSVAVTDSTGRVATAAGVTIDLYWGNAN